jgi:hypothetical protein
MVRSGYYLLCIMVAAHCLILPASAQQQAREGIEGKPFVWVAGNLPEGSTVTGKWSWSETLTHDMVRTHTQYSEGEISRYSFRIKDSIALDKNSRIIQSVFLDPENRPSGIMLKFFTADSGEIIFYWEGYEEAFAELDEYISAWYMGFMPEAGVWVKLIMDFKELDISKAELLGMEFILINGRLWWGETIIDGID